MLDVDWKFAVANHGRRLLRGRRPRDLDQKRLSWGLCTVSYRDECSGDVFGSVGQDASPRSARSSSRSRGSVRSDGCTPCLSA